MQLVVLNTVRNSIGNSSLQGASRLFQLIETFAKPIAQIKKFKIPPF
jgi:hypothetical protein